MKDGFEEKLEKLKLALKEFMACNTIQDKVNDNETDSPNSIEQPICLNDLTLITGTDGHRYMQYIEGDCEILVGIDNYTHIRIKKPLREESCKHN